MAPKLVERVLEESKSHSLRSKTPFTSLGMGFVGGAQLPIDRMIINKNVSKNFIKLGTIIQIKKIMQSIYFSY
jgi:hypothetical protein